jgi:hypothetical protein
LRLARPDNILAGPRPLYDDIARVDDWFMFFSQAVMLIIARKADLQRERIKSDKIVDLDTVHPVIFIDEDAPALKRAVIQLTAGRPLEGQA